jgi:hypothetical protein
MNMKKIFYFAIIALALLSGLTGCIKNEPVTFNQPYIEFDASTWNANAAGRTYPVLTRVPIAGIVTPSSQPLITRATGSVNLRVNMLGEQTNDARNFTYRVVTGESTAVEGVHYTAFSGTAPIGGRTSFGTVNVNILNPGVSSATPVILVLEVTDNGVFRPSVNYAKVGLSISQL